MASIGIYQIPSNGYARMTCQAMAMGGHAIGDQVTVLTDRQYKGPEFDIAVFWGYIQTCQDILNGYKAANKPALYLDLAYWQRDHCFKVSIGGRHPTSYFQRRPHDDKRRKMFGVEPVQEYQNQGYILVAGMGPKAAWAEKCEPVESWERNAITTIRQFTDRYIVYRPKPSQHYGNQIAGAELDTRTPIGTALAKSFAVVTHHSNVGVDGLVAGVPCFTEQGVAVPMSYTDLSRIESPRYPDFATRMQWLNDVAYVQWSVQEMKSGAVLRYFKDEGLIP